MNPTQQTAILVASLIGGVVSGVGYAFIMSRKSPEQEIYTALKKSMNNKKTKGVGKK
ncbi:MAG: hypothetical protein GF353_09625 [Candidatus Lokiarchaeota archaeon]|nr:hypothetical protein [Candidatus Lokiarchaeota archaeon]